MMRSVVAATTAVMLLTLSACGEKPQAIAQGGLKKEDSKAWDSSDSRYMAAGWQPGDKASWEAQMRARAQQGQNESSRIAAVPAAAK
jgi:hypothetical protein